MKGLPSLIRLHKWQLEEQQRQLAQLEGLQQQFIDRIGILDAEVAAESAAGAASETGHVLGGYIQASLQRRRHLEQSAAGVQVQIDQVREHVAGAFEELKRFELAHELHLRRERKTARRRERVQEDEIGLNIFRRRQVWQPKT